MIIAGDKMAKLNPRIHITGASGCGVTTLGRELAVALGGIALDTDDFYWVPTHPPFQFKRPIEERLRLLRASLPENRAWILSGTLGDWGASLTPRFDLVVFLEAPAEVRIARLRERESRRFGNAAVAPGGYFYSNHEEFIDWAAHYDSGTLPGRSRPRHERWLAALPCPVLRLNGERPIVESVAAVRACLAFHAPLRLAAWMGDLPCPWFVAGGWALDLFLETVTRPHGDIEMLIFREDQAVLQNYLTMSDGVSLTKLERGVEHPWTRGETLEPSIHQLRARSTDFDFDIFIADSDVEHWRFRRDRRVVRLKNEIGAISAHRIPFLIPEIVLLFKAKLLLEKDHADFTLAAPHLSAEARRWLTGALALAYPECVWRNGLDH
jgi:adenylate kinase family enzyme